MNDATAIIKSVKDGKALLIDVRSKAEYKMGHAQKAVNIPVDSIQNMKPVAADMPIFMYCASGMRSGQAAMILQGQGYQNVTNLGGIGAWQRIGGKITS